MPMEIKFRKKKLKGQEKREMNLIVMRKSLMRMSPITRRKNLKVYPRRKRNDLFVPFLKDGLHLTIITM
jgi:hypothetical protein